MFCFRIFTLPAPSGFFQRTSPFVLSRHHSARLSPSATFRKMRSRQMIGGDPLQPSIATFQTTFSSVVHLTGRFFSLLTPLRAGPRHCGQFWAWATANVSRTKPSTPRLRFRIISDPPIRPQKAQKVFLCFFALAYIGERSLLLLRFQRRQQW